MLKLKTEVKKVRKLKKHEAIIVCIFGTVIAVNLYVYAFVFLGYVTIPNPDIKMFLLWIFVPVIIVFGWPYLVLRYLGERNFAHEPFSWS